MCSRASRTRTSRAERSCAGPRWCSRCCITGCGICCDPLDDCQPERALCSVAAMSRGVTPRSARQADTREVPIGAGIQLLGGGEIGMALCSLALAQLRQAADIECVRVVGLELDRGTVVRRCLAEITLPEVDHATHVQYRGNPRGWPPGLG